MEKKIIQKIATFAKLLIVAQFALVATHAVAGDYGKKKDIVDTAVSAGQFNTLAAALDAAGLIDTLKGDGPFTVFAPTDEAFAKLPEGTVESLLQPENKRPARLAMLTYHVVPGKVEGRRRRQARANAKTVNGAKTSRSTFPTAASASTTPTSSRRILAQATASSTSSTP